MTDRAVTMRVTHPRVTLGQGVRSSMLIASAGAQVRIAARAYLISGSPGRRAGGRRDTAGRPP
ncbi:hypothetical protein GCM10025331_68050 [Actinoplanes utahensis]|nr:hypothetical protein Aut01nite_01070 [Actinoplanes utahensis]